MASKAVTTNDEGGRTSGFQRPHSRNQLISWYSMSVSLGIFYAVALGFVFTVESLEATILLVLQVAVLLPSLGLWLFLETHDPAEPSCWGSCLPASARWTTQKYCRIRKKRIEGLDHFCEWLNISIGRTNYLPFMLLVALGIIQFLLQIALGLVIAISISQAGYPSAGRLVLVVGAALNIAISALVGCMYVMLLGFHVYLGWRNMSTYDYTIEQTKKHRQGRKKAASTANPKADPEAPPPVVGPLAQQQEDGLELS